jgi:glycerol kinase
LTASVVDQQAALYGHGCRVAGDTKITFGTGAFALSLTGSHLRMDSQQRASANRRMVDRR